MRRMLALVLVALMIVSTASFTFAQPVAEEIIVTKMIDHDGPGPMEYEEVIEWGITISHTLSDAVYEVDSGVAFTIDDSGLDLPDGTYMIEEMEDPLYDNVGEEVFYMYIFEGDVTFWIIEDWRVEVLESDLVFMNSRKTFTAYKELDADGPYTDEDFGPVEGWEIELLDDGENLMFKFGSGMEVPVPEPGTYFLKEKMLDNYMVVGPEMIRMEVAIDEDALDIDYFDGDQEIEEPIFANARMFEMESFWGMGDEVLVGDKVNFMEFGKAWGGYVLFDVVGSPYFEVLNATGDLVADKDMTVGRFGVTDDDVIFLLEENMLLASYHIEVLNVVADIPTDEDGGNGKFKKNPKRNKKEDINPKIGHFEYKMDYMPPMAIDPRMMLEIDGFEIEIGEDAIAIHGKVVLPIPVGEDFTPLDEILYPED